MDAPYRHIACCLDRSDGSKSVLETGKRLRSLGPGRLTIVHVAPWGIIFGGYPGVDLADTDDFRADAQAWLNESVAANPGTEGVLLDGYPPAAVCEWAEGADVDLIIAASSRGIVDRVLLGSFAGYLARHAHCPVLLTRPAATAKSGNVTATGEEVRR